MNLHEQILRIQEVMGIISEGEYFTKPLMRGKRNDEVTKLQDIFKMDEIDGVFGEDTDECVREFQEFANIKVDGIVGPETRGKLNELIDGKLKGWLGCKKTVSQEKEPTDKGSAEQEILVKKPSQIGPNDVVGSSWRSCKAWSRAGGLNKWGDRVSISTSSSKFTISYKGPSSGVSMAHRTGGGDTIHQIYNILICEINPFLAQGGMKPNINDISIKGGRSGKDSTIEINVPLTSTEGVYQLDRRGGWNHDPGSSKMASKCKKLIKQGKKCEGPVTKIVSAPYGKITEYFVTHEA